MASVTLRGSSLPLCLVLSLLFYLHQFKKDMLITDIYQSEDLQNASHPKKSIDLLTTEDSASSLLEFVGRRRYATVLADPPWQFNNKTGKVAPEHRRLSRYKTMKIQEIADLPVGEIVDPTAHLYLWCPNALLPDGLSVMSAWGFTYKSNIVWHKIRKDGGSDGRGVGFYFRNVTELLLFGVRGKNARTLDAGRTQVNYLATRKREHSRKPDEVYDIIESCSRPSRLELFARGTRAGWDAWGDEADQEYEPSWPTYNHSTTRPRN